MALHDQTQSHLARPALKMQKVTRRSRRLAWRDKRFVDTLIGDELIGNDLIGAKSIARICASGAIRLDRRKPIK